MKVLISITLCGILSHTCNAQKLMYGTVIDSDGKPVPYVNIGIRNKNVGTYSYENGVFSLSILEDHLNDSLTFSCIGYKTYSQRVDHFSFFASNSIRLQESISSLNEVIVTPKKHKNSTIFLGIKKQNSGSDIRIAYPHRGSEVGLVIEANSYPVFINKIHIKFRAANLDTVHLQARIYLLDSNQIPSIPLDYKLVEKVSTKETECQFYLYTPIEIRETTFISFQWLVSEWQAKKIDQVNSFQNQLISNYVPKEYSDYGVTIYDQKKISVRNQQGEEIKSFKIKKSDIKPLKAKHRMAPGVSFLTAKREGLTLYRSHSLGKWYRYDQNLIAWIETYADNQ